jgi:hypothetical protein
MQLTREQPWHLRRVTSSHERALHRILDLHALTRRWIYDLKLENDAGARAFGLKRVIGPVFSRELEFLEQFDEQLSGRPFSETLLGEKPEEVLSRMEASVEAIQGYLLGRLLEETADSERQALRTTLEQSSWSAGRECAGWRWKEFPRPASADLRGIFSALLDSPFSQLPRRVSFLVQRATANELAIDWLTCPHKSAHLEATRVADDLCAMHTQMMRGFCYSIESTAQIFRTPSPTGRPCELRFLFHPGAS